MEGAEVGVRGDSSASRIARLDPSTEAWQLLQANRPPPRNPLAS